MVLSQNQNLNRCLKPVSRTGRLSLINQSQHQPSVRNGVVAIVHNPKVLQTLDAVRKRSLPIIQKGFHLVIAFLFYCLLFFLLAARSLVIQQKSSLEMLLAIYFLASWQDLHSVFRRIIIAGFILGQFFYLTFNLLE